MQKLSKEQSEWLLNQIAEQVKSNQSDSYYRGVDIEVSEIRNIIDASTEKPFPEFIGSYKDGPKTLSDVEIKQHTYNPVYTHIILKNYCVGVHNDHPVFQDIIANFTPEQFKQFTEGCNKIVEWINENVD